MKWIELKRKLYNNYKRTQRLISKINFKFKRVYFFIFGLKRGKSSKPIIYDLLGIV